MPFELALPSDYSDDYLLRTVREKIGDTPFEILIKSLDARNHKNIVWRVSIGPARGEMLSIPRCVNKKSVIVVGYGPAGYFSALALAMAGFKVTVLEQGADVRQREISIREFEENRKFSSDGTYVYGEGGAGTFSDGKLTSRTRSISKEKKFILSTYVSCGAPEEILYLSKPHIGSDILRSMMPKLRAHLQEYGAAINFSEKVSAFSEADGRCRLVTDSGEYTADAVIFATGHSDFDTYRMLINSGLRFSVKTFALGMRMEHEQSFINRLQWGSEKVPGLLAAEYQLTCATSQLPVYTFCMCPGGRIVPSSASPQRSTVNGASEYARAGGYANAAIVAAINLEERMGISNPLDALAFVEQVEQRACERGLFSAPCTSIDAFIKGGLSPVAESSYPFELYPDDYTALYPREILDSIREGLGSFCQRIKGFEQGALVGVETTTSPPVQLQREAGGRAAGYSSVYMCGEGSGFAGGIISSGADGLRCALALIEKFSAK